MICRPVFVGLAGFPRVWGCLQGRMVDALADGTDDVAGSDMPRGAAERALIRGFLNGETRQPSWAVTAPWCGGYAGK